MRILLALSILLSLVSCTIVRVIDTKKTHTSIRKFQSESPKLMKLLEADYADKEKVARALPADSELSSSFLVLKKDFARLVSAKDKLSATASALDQVIGKKKKILGTDPEYPQVVELSEKILDEENDLKQEMDRYREDNHIFEKHLKDRGYGWVIPEEVTRKFSKALIFLDEVCGHGDKQIANVELRGREEDKATIGELRSDLNGLRSIRAEIAVVLKRFEAMPDQKSKYLVLPTNPDDAKFLALNDAEARSNKLVKDFNEKIRRIAGK